MIKKILLTIWHATVVAIAFYCLLEKEPARAALGFVCGQAIGAGICLIQILWRDE